MRSRLNDTGARQRYGAGQRKDSTGNTGARGNGVADVREDASSKSGVGAESGGAASLPEDISCGRSFGQDNRGIAGGRKRGPHLENVDTAAVEREGSGQLRRSIKTIDARRERGRAGTGAQSLASQVSAAGLRDEISVCRVRSGLSRSGGGIAPADFSPAHFFRRAASGACCSAHTQMSPVH